jgi:hypothetical protein
MINRKLIFVAIVVFEVAFISLYLEGGILSYRGAILPYSPT